MVFEKGTHTKTEFKKGHKGFTYWKGKLRSEDTKNKICIANKGKHSSVKTEFKKGTIIVKSENWIKNQRISLKSFYQTKAGIKRRKELSEAMKATRAKQVFPFVDSSIEVKIKDFLDLLSIKYFQHKYMDIKHSYQCDFLIPSINLVLEADGTYWHNYPYGLEKDHVRTTELVEKGFNVLRLWEHEIRKMKVEDFKNILEENFGIYS